jgi:hypothetical protein
LDGWIEEELLRRRNRKMRKIKEKYRGIRVTGRGRPAPARLNRGEFLALNPAARKVQEVLVRRINQLHKEIRQLSGNPSRWVAAVNRMRRAGLAVIDLGKELPGGRLTPSFYRQMAGAGTVQLHAKLWELREYQRVARHFDKDIRAAAEILQVRDVFLRLARVKIERKQERRREHLDSWGEIRCLITASRLEEWLELMRANPHYYPGEKLREDLREVYAVVWKKWFRAVDSLRSDLGIQLDPEGKQS